MPPAARRPTGALRRGGAAVARGARASGRAVRRATHSGGAGASGLARMLELHLLSSAADALIVTALASTIFFAVPTDQARDRVATSLLVTMVPFLVLAPVIGPFLDRFRRGRRYALATTMVVRAFLAWVMASAIAGATPAFSLYPAAFGFLVCQKAYMVTRAAAVPRVLPEQARLVTVNARMAAVGVIALSLGGSVGVAVTRLAGPDWTLRLAFVVFAAGTALALSLSSQVDSDGATLDPTRIDVEESEPARVRATQRRRPRISRGERGKSARSIGATAVIGLRGNAAMRAFTGFLTLFLAFRLRTDPLPGIAPTTAVALVIVVAAVGGGVGTALGVLARRMRPAGVVGGTARAGRPGHPVGGLLVRHGSDRRCGTGRRAGTGAGQALPGRADPGRGTRRRPDVGLRPLGDRAAACLGGRRRAGAGAAAVRSLGIGRGGSAHRPGGESPRGAASRGSRIAHEPCAPAAGEWRTGGDPSRRPVERPELRPRGRPQRRAAPWRPCARRTCRGSGRDATRWRRRPGA